MAAPAIDVVVDQGDLARIQRLLRGVPGGLQRVIPSAINRTATQVRTRASRRIRDVSGIKVGEIRKRIVIARATRTRWSAKLNLSSKRFPLMMSAARQTMKGVTFSMGKGKRGFMKSGFIRTVAGGNFAGQEHVLKRKSEGGGKLVGRLPVFIKWGRSLAGHYELAPQVASGLMAESAERLRINIDRRVRFLLERQR